MAQFPTIIAGGGISGLAAALALGKRDGLILERAEKFNPAGAGLQLGPNAIRALQKLGAWDAVSAIVSSPPEIHIWDGLTGQQLKRLSLGSRFAQRFGEPYCVAHRADLHGALLEVVKTRASIGLEMATCVEGIDSFAEGVAIRAIGETFKGSQLWAADGVHSSIRQLLVEGSAPIDSGTRFHRELLAKVPAVKNVAFECINLWMYPGGHVVHYPVGVANQLNIVAVVPDGARPASHFENACEGLKEIVGHLRNASIWPGLYVKPLQTWQHGNITLLGDAAHGTLPYLAQGAAMALEDAAALLDCNPETLSARQLRTKLLHNKTLAAGRTYHSRGVVRLARNLVLSSLPQSFLQNQLAWIYRHG